MGEVVDSESLAYPILRLKVSAGYAVAVIGSQLHVFDLRCVSQNKTEVLDNLSSFSCGLNSSSIPAPDRRTVPTAHKGPISQLAIDTAEEHAVTIGLEDKLLKVWSLKDLSELSCRSVHWPV
jgi:hypothetical protein